MHEWADRRDRRSERSGRGGFALPMVLLVLVVLTVAAAAAIQTAGYQRQAGGGSLESTKALYGAEAGLNDVIASWDSARYDTLVPNPGDSADLGWQTLPENGAAYRATIHRVGEAGASLFNIVAEGSGSGVQECQRRVSVMLGESSSLTEAGLTTQGSVVAAEDPTMILEGIDTNPPAWVCDAPSPAVPGAMVSPTTSVTYGAGTVTGDPPIKVDSTMDATRFTQFGDLSYADLVAMADKTYPGGSEPAFFGPVVAGGNCNTSVQSNWGDPLNPSAPCGDYFPIIHFAGNVEFTTNGSAGQDILLVDGELAVGGGDFTFYGLIIVQGNCVFEYQSLVYGAVFCANPTVVGDAAAVRYSSCVLERAAGMGGGGTGVVEGSWKELEY